MKKMLLAVILMAAAGGALYYFLQNKNQTSSESNFEKGLVVGKWKIDSLSAANDSIKVSIGWMLLGMDSLEKKRVYEIQNDGSIYASLAKDSLTEKDTSSFSWGKNNEFLLKYNPTDTTAENLKVVKLNKESFVLQSNDSVLIYLKKI